MLLRAFNVTSRKIISVNGSGGIWGISSVRYVNNYDYQPGPYPKTVAERIAAAKKYNLHPSVYEPYADDGFGYGDYPKLPKISAEARDDFYPWDDPAWKRNFNEPIHVEEANINEYRLNVNHRYYTPIWRQWLEFFGFVAVVCILQYFSEKYKNYQPAAIKQMPKNGPYYSFELVD